MLSISFLPWLLAILAIVISVPTVNFIENRRRKQALAELEAERERERAAVEQSESDEVVGEGLDDPGAGDFGGFDAGGDFGGVPGDDPFGDAAATPGFDDDEFK